MKRAIPATFVAAIVMKKSQTESPLRRMLIIPHLSELPMNTIIGRNVRLSAAEML